MEKKNNNKEYLNNMDDTKKLNDSIEKEYQFLIDEEIELNNENDFLNTQKYAENLSKILSNTPKDKPFIIGLFGEWGSGKSSIIKTALKKCEEEKKDNIVDITYDAWKYSNDSFRRTFLLEIQKKLGFKQSELMEQFYENKNIDIIRINILQVLAFFFFFIYITSLLYLYLLLISNNKFEIITSTQCF